VNPKPPEEKRYTVFVDDNYHFMDESERYKHGVFATPDEAVAQCKMLVDEFLKSAHKPGMTPEELYRHYSTFGDDPWVSPRSESGFGAWKYARLRCEEMCRSAGTASGTLRRLRDRVAHAIRRAVGRGR
jgi:hypothetical protein